MRSYIFAITINIRCVGGGVLQLINVFLCRVVLVSVG